MWWRIGALIGLIFLAVVIEMQSRRIDELIATNARLDVELSLRNFMLTKLNHDLRIANEIAETAENEKQKIYFLSQQKQAAIKLSLQNSACGSERIPDDAVNSMYQTAASLYHAPADSGEVVGSMSAVATAAENDVR